MLRRQSSEGRRGTIIPLVVLTLVGMCGFVALAVDIGLVALAKTQCQNAADAAAVAGARSLDGTPGQNLGAVGVPNSAWDNAQQVAFANTVNGDTLTAANLAIRFGAWHYDKPSQRFVPQFPPEPPDNYNLCEVTVTYTVQAAFGRAFAVLDPSFNSAFNVTAVSQAAHRPRDVCIILDYSGSMNNESDLWNCEAYLDNGQTNTTNNYRWPKPGNMNLTSNNIETVYPLFGHYVGTSGTARSGSGNDYSDYTANPNLLSPAASPGNALYGNPAIGKCNISVPILGIPALVNDLYQNARGATPQAAFTAWPDTYASGTDPAQGDNYLPKAGTSTTPPTYALHVKDITGGTGYHANFETKGYQYFTGKAFKGYTLGPRYWGKTFFVWPPDPTNDWRKKFFFKSDGVTPLDDNTLLFQNTYPGYKDPSGNYRINYKAILNWIKNTGANPFPSQLRSGYVLFYDSIPADVPAAAYDHTKPNSNIADPNQRFWKEYIDFALGVWRDPHGNVQHPQQPACSMGPDFMFGGSSAVGISGKPAPSGGNQQYMSYTDNPWRPRHRFWFGPMTMLQFMSDTGLLPGTTHDISMYPMKSGVGAALTNIQNNHPNDVVAMLLFSRPQYDNDPPGCGTFNNPQFSLSRDYQGMINSLWLPPNSSTADVRPWDSNGVQVPRAHGDFDANTASSYGFMLAYNQFSDAASLSAAGVGGNGRKGSTRLVIYETDGMANENSVPLTGDSAGFVNSGPYNSYYAVRPGDPINGGGYDETRLLQVVQAICNKDDGTPYQSPPSGYPTPPAYPGFATANKRVTVHCIAFGAIFEVPSSIQTNSVTLLQKISTIGGTTFPSSPTDPANGYKWCTGTLTERQDKLKQAFLTILNSAVPVSVIQ